ncbi:MAG: winged helix-turn-helix transcriptional regulator [Acidobacteria bacterium]|nr:winged helix-turn-helix transcriptional regulator [Acidobacteriota bacterium]NIQ30629.1 winged helix-turn-helix transcriptional regulator [Acidobacteriota bacterium]NIQ85587.1 winged helix-turn-helix transcriptional regulator [Acidobacteriota bacterium]
MPAKTKLDRTDCEILAELQKNARVSNKELAARIGLAPSTSFERVRGLVSDGVLRGYHAEVDPAALGIGLEAMVAIRIAKHSRELIEEFRRHVAVLPEVVANYHVGGANDFLVHVAVRDAEHLRTVVLESFSTRPEVVHIETSLVFEHEYRWELPNYACAVEAG